MVEKSLALEKVFRVRRRTVVNLMAQFGGYQAGRTFLVPKQQLLETLAAAQAAPPVQQQIGRKQRLRTLRAAEPISTVPSPLPSVRAAGLAGRAPTYSS